MSAALRIAALLFVLRPAAAQDAAGPDAFRQFSEFLVGVQFVASDGSSSRSYGVIVGATESELTVAAPVPAGGGSVDAVRLGVLVLSSPRVVHQDEGGAGVQLISVPVDPGGSAPPAVARAAPGVISCIRAGVEASVPTNAGQVVPLRVAAKRAGGEFVLDGWPEEGVPAGAPVLGECGWLGIVLGRVERADAGPGLLARASWHIEKAVEAAAAAPDEATPDDGEPAPPPMVAECPQRALPVSYGRGRGETVVFRAAGRAASHEFVEKTIRLEGVDPRDTVKIVNLSDLSPFVFVSVEHADDAERWTLIVLCRAGGEVRFRNSLRVRGRKVIAEVAAEHPPHEVFAIRVSDSLVAVWTSRSSGSGAERDSGFLWAQESRFPPLALGIARTDGDLFSMLSLSRRGEVEVLHLPIGVGVPTRGPELPVVIFDGDVTPDEQPVRTQFSGGSFYVLGRRRGYTFRRIGSGDPHGDRDGPQQPVYDLSRVDQAEAMDVEVITSSRDGGLALLQLMKYQNPRTEQYEYKMRVRRLSAREEDDAGELPDIDLTSVLGGDEWTNARLFAFSRDAAFRRVLMLVAGNSARGGHVRGAAATLDRRRTGWKVAPKGEPLDLAGRLDVEILRTLAPDFHVYQRLYYLGEDGFNLSLAGP